MTDWNELSDADADALRPYILQCADLSGEACQTVRRDFLLAMTRGLSAMASTIDREPNKTEIDMLRRAMTRHFNAFVIPAALAIERPGMLH